MPKKVKFTDLVKGAGLIAETNSQVIVHVRGLLNRGEVFMDTRQEKQPLRIRLQTRDCIAGLRYGIVGMQVGGRRELVVSPHLGYGATGIPGKVPPDAVLKFEVELLEVCESGVMKPEDYQPGRHLYFFWPGEAKRNQPRIQFGLDETGRCGAHLTIPRPELSWRYAKVRSAEQQLDQNEMLGFFDEVSFISQKFPKNCLSNDQLWADSSEKGNSVTRDSLSDTPCITIGILERGIWQCYYALKENDSVLLESKLFGFVKKLVSDFLPDSSRK